MQDHGVRLRQPNYEDRTMANDIKLPFTQEELLENLPAERLLSEMPTRYRTLFQECLQEYRVSRRHVGKDLADLTVSLARNLKDGFQNAVKWVDSLIPDFDLTPAPRYEYATRAIGGSANGETPKKFSFEKPGNGCSIVIDVELVPTGANLVVKLIGDDGNAVLPFFMTVRDCDSGTSLLQNRKFTYGAAKLNGVERGKYELIASGNGVNCDFSLVVE